MTNSRSLAGAIALSALLSLPMQGCGDDDNASPGSCDEDGDCAGGAGEGGEASGGEDATGTGGRGASGGSPSDGGEPSSAGQGGEGGVEPGSFTYEIDAALEPEAAEFDGEPVSAVADEAGKTSLFVATEVWISPASQAELEDFLDRTAGTLIGDDAVPEPPEDSGIQITPEDREPTQYVVRVDTSDVDLDAFESDAGTLGLDGSATIANEEGARLLALVARERAAGLELGPSFLLQSDLVHSSEEHPLDEGYVDAFAISRFGSVGAKSNVVAAWQIVSERGEFERVRLAVIDGGFWVDSEGEPMSALDSGLSDLPGGVWQYDFVGGDYVTGSRCRDSGGDCGWHGNQSASVSTGPLDNRYGVAGTGGLVSDPILLDMNFTFPQVATAIRTAVSWGASVISMSLGGDCDDFFCGEFGGLSPAMRNAWNNNVVMVAAAGNGGDDGIGDVSNSQPCRGDHVICVGALLNDSNTAIGYSNYGGFVDIWAPTNIPAMPNGDSAGALVNASGTSAATPFVAGIIAMLRAYDDTLNADEIRDILRETAWTDSPDARVTHYVNAEAALRAVIGDYSTAPEVSIVRRVGEGEDVDLNRGFDLLADTFDLEDGDPCCSVTWTPEPEITSDSGRNAVFNFDSEGSQEITAVATDSSGNTAEATYTVNVVNSPPEVTILLPTPSTVVYSGQPLQLSGLALDANSGLGPDPGPLACNRLVWTSDRGADESLFPITGCDGEVTLVEPGTHILLLTATDPEGEGSTDTVAVGVLDPPTNFPPNISVGGWPPPAELGGEPGYDSTLPIEVTASATDPESDTPIAYEWRATVYIPSQSSSTAVYASGVIGTSANLDWTPDNTPSLLISDCIVTDANFGQRVRVTLEATDSLGNSSVRTLPDIYVYRCILI